MKPEIQLSETIIQLLNQIQAGLGSAEQVQLQKTKKEFEGDFTLVTFGFAKQLRQSPEDFGKMLGEKLMAESNSVSGYNVVKGFLNISLSDTVWLSTIHDCLKPDFGKASTASGKTYLVEYSSPNTNKPLHLGHLRNNFLGYSVSEILKANGHQVIKTQVINDRGIHICKSMLAWEKFGNGETPQSSGLKGDKLVGKYYVKFDSALREELKPILAAIYEQRNLDLFADTEKENVQKLLDKFDQIQEAFLKEKSGFNADDFQLFGGEIAGIAGECAQEKSTFKSLSKAFESVEKPDAAQKELIKKVKTLASFESKMDDVKGEIKEIAQNKTTLMKAAQQMLLQWEKGDEHTIALWKKMNGWVYEGFDETYKTIGVDFDKLYYESDTYLLGKDQVMDGLAKGVFFKKEDGSVWCDLTADGLDEKLVLRGDGTSVYITQDIGTAIERFKDFPSMNGMIYTVGNEQDYHFKVLFLILKKLGYEWANELFHLSYGMVDLPSGKMKSREGTVVDADDLAREMQDEAKAKTTELGKLNEVPEEERDLLFHTLGMGALKYFILKVDPKKRMMFNPAESIDFQGNTGPFLQYTYARIRSILRKADVSTVSVKQEGSLLAEEKSVLLLLNEFPEVVKNAAKELSPALIGNYVYELVKTYNHFYQSLTILKEEDADKKTLRLALSIATGNVVKTGLQLMGIGVPERM